MKLTSLSVRRRVATGVITLALLVLGIYGFVGLAVDFLPDITYPLIKVHIWWRGATPEDIVNNVADPIERQMATVDGLDYLTSSSIEGMYTLEANFKYGVDIDVAYQDALAAMARVARQLPSDIDPPVVIKADPSQLPVAQLTIASQSRDLVQLRTWTENWFQDQLIAVAGVAGTEVVGGLKREIRVSIDPQALEKYGLPLATVIRRLREENIEQAAGRVTEGRREFIARTVGEFRTMDDIRSVVLATNGPATVLIGDVASVSDTHEEVRVITRLGGRPCVKLSVLKQSGANTVEVARAVQERIAALRSAIPPDIEIGTVENQADYIESSLNGVRNAALEAALLVMIVVYLFLGSWRQVLVMAIALPLTLVLNFGLMKLAGFSLNIFSLGGLVVSIGVLLSNTIVVVENITRWRRTWPDMDPADQVADATAEVGSPVVAATTTFLALFLPFLLVPGLTSLLFRELILVVAGIVAISLAVAVTITPTLSYLVLRRANTATTRFERFFDRVSEGYGRVLGRVISARWLTLLVFLIVVAGAGLAVKRVGSEFLPQMDDGRIMIKVKMPTGAALGQTDAILKRIENAIADDPLIESAFTLSGGKVWGLYTYEIANEGEVDLQLVPRSARSVTTKQYIEDLRPRLSSIQAPGGKVMVAQAKMKGLRRLGEADIEVKIKGQDASVLFDLARRTAESMNELARFTNVYVSLDMTKPEYAVTVDRVRAAQLGLSVSDVSSALRTSIGGTVATSFREDNDYYNIRVIVPETRIQNRQDIENLLIPRTTGGGNVYLRDIATVTASVGPVEIIREDQVKEVIVRGDVVGASVGEALAELKAAVGQTPLPTGYEISYGGQAQMMAEMARNVVAILAFAVFFAFVVLAVQFNSLKLPGLILGGTVVAASGLLYALMVAGLPMGATVIIGALLVVAAMVNDGVLLLTFAEDLRTREELSPFAAVVQAAMLRLRPITMTTVPMIVGFIPLALNLEEGGDMLQPMAAAAIGGLSLEIIVALFLMPCLYVFATRSSSNSPDEAVLAVEKGADDRLQEGESE
ncbi:MAG TPA: efflux RND transporter permease subunit [Candidatus Latescibacteria bacterium]|nr:efflux RND transporter permease subunit [Candidatus Latescibacterota bacterium]HPK74587.1 efflux RND transporter permease subunit [Candidatus Latescibacterota bacterium]